MTEWIAVTERLPDINAPVWLHEAGIMFVGVRVDDADGWLWARCYDTHYFNNKTRCWKSFGAEMDDDYQPSHWMPLPEPPALSDAAGAPPKDDERLDALAHEIWAAAQLVPGEGITDGVDRIAAILKGKGNG